LNTLNDVNLIIIWKFAGSVFEIPGFNVVVRRCNNESALYKALFERMLGTVLFRYRQPFFARQTLQCLGLRKHLRNFIFSFNFSGEEGATEAVNSDTVVTEYKTVAVVHSKSPDS